MLVLEPLEQTGYCFLPLPHADAYKATAEA